MYHKGLKNKCQTTSWKMNVLHLRLGKPTRHQSNSLRRIKQSSFSNRRESWSTRILKWFTSSSQEDVKGAKSYELQLSAIYHLSDEYCWDFVQISYKNIPIHGNNNLIISIHCQTKHEMYLLFENINAVARILFQKVTVLSLIRSNI